MGQSHGDALEVARSLQQQAPPESVEEVRDDLNAVETLIGALTPQNDYEEAMLAVMIALRDDLERVLDSGMGGESVDTTTLSTGRIGRAVFDIPNGEEGQARFEIGGGDFLVTIHAEETIKWRQPVVIVGAGNKARPLPSTDLNTVGDLRQLNPDNYFISESDDLPSVSQGGSVTVPPGTSEVIVRLEGADGRVVGGVAVGATDHADAEYTLLRDGSAVVGGRTNSPLGLLTSPFSFVETLNGIIPAQDKLEYVVTNNGNTSIDVVGRLHGVTV